MLRNWSEPSERIEQQFKNQSRNRLLQNRMEHATRIQVKKSQQIIIIILEILQGNHYKLL